MQYFHANVCGSQQNGACVPTILGAGSGCRSHKMYLDVPREPGRSVAKFHLEDPDFAPTDVTIAAVSAPGYSSVEVWFHIDGGVGTTDLVTRYTRFERTAERGWDITNIVYQRGRERVLPPAIIGETVFA